MNDEILSGIKETIIKTIIEEPDNPIVANTAIALGSIKPKLQSKTLEQLQKEARQKEERRQEQIRFTLKIQGREYRCSSGVADGCVANEVYEITKFNVAMCKVCFDYWYAKDLKEQNKFLRFD